MGGKPRGLSGDALLGRALNSITYEGLENFGRYYSVYKAWVFDNQDPDNLCRLKVVIPDITGEAYLDEWVYPRGLTSGVSDLGVIYGEQNIPEKGDLVYVSFELGDISAPMWEHGYRGEDEVPTEAEFQDINSRWFKTPKGHGVIINDTAGTINIFHATGKAYVIDKDGISQVSDKISLGQLGTSNEPAVLGNKNEDVLNKVHDILDKISTALNADLAALTSIGAANLVTLAPQLILLIAQLNTAIPNTKSTKVTLD